MASAPLFRSGMLRECWAYRGFIAASVKRDFTARYLGTNLGFFWAVAQPLAMILIYTLVLSAVMKPALPGRGGPFAYSIYLCAGITLWQLFSELLTRSIGVFVHNATLLKKAALPKLAFPIVVTLSGLTNFAVIFALFLAFTAVIGAFPGASLAAMVPVILLLACFALGLGVLLGTINVFYRDVEQSVAMLLQFWFWLTPIVYPGRALPGFAADLLAVNPLWPIVHFAQTIFVEDRVPPWSMLAYPTLAAAVLLALGWLAFRRLAGEIVDEL